MKRSTVHVLSMEKCPICGSEPEMMKNQDNPTFEDWMRCPKCGLETLYHDDSQTGARVGWNKSVQERKWENFTGGTAAALREISRLRSALSQIEGYCRGVLPKED